MLPLRKFQLSTKILLLWMKKTVHVEPKDSYLLSVKNIKGAKKEMYVTFFEILHFGFLLISLSLANLLLILILQSIKGCPLYIFASLFCMYKKEHLQNKEQFLFHFESSFRSWGNQGSQISWRHQMPKHGPVFVKLKKENFLSKNFIKNVV